MPPEHNSDRHTLVHRIDDAWVAEEAKNDPFRAHLGGSMIGKECERELMYSFRWAKKPDFSGRMLRLFNRGHKEEFRFVAFLRMIGFDVREYANRLVYDVDMAALDPGKIPYMLLDWDADWSSSGLMDVTDNEEHIARAHLMGVKLKQWRISDVMGHFGGSLDGLGSAPFKIPVDAHLTVDDLESIPTARFIPANEEVLLEFKTHNSKSFTKLVIEGVRNAKPVHWAQMQVYMHKRKLRFAIYVAVNKNDDDLHIEVVDYDERQGPILLERAERVIKAGVLPGRLCKNPSQFEAKFCDFAGPCWHGKAIERNCRTCKFSQPVEDGQWRCNQWNAIIPVDAILKGCDSYSVITD